MLNKIHVVENHRRHHEFITLKIAIFFLYKTNFLVTFFFFRGNYVHFFYQKMGLIIL